MWSRYGVWIDESHFFEQSIPSASMDVSSLHESCPGRDSFQAAVWSVFLSLASRVVELHVAFQLRSFFPGCLGMVLIHVDPATLVVAAYELPGVKVIKM